MKNIPILLSILLLQSCSTMFNTGSQSIRVSADKQYHGVEVEISSASGSYSAKLPTAIVATPSTFKDINIKVIDECYLPTSIAVPRSCSFESLA